MSYSELKEKSSAASERFNALNEKIKKLDQALADNAELQKQIVIYSKTRQTYVDYRKAGYSKKFKAQHEADIILHQTAKKYFDELGYGKGKSLPKVAELRSDYAILLNEKKQHYKDYRNLKAEMRELLTSRANVDSLFSTDAPQHHERKLHRNEPEL